MTTPHPPPLTALTDGDPARIGLFDIRGRIGAGGMGVVYGATDSGGRWVALKLIRGEFTDDPEFRGRFAREVDLMRRVRSRSVAPLLAADTTHEGDPWYATPYVAGPTLQQRVRQGGALEPGPTQALAVGLAEAVAAIHTAGVFHRDLKPANVVLATDGPKVLDFGIARAVDESAITRTGGVVGSPGWMSPERFRGHTGPEADVFAWAALVAYAATGRAPFGTGSAETLMYRVLNEAPDLAALPAELVGVLTRALDKDPAARPGSADLVRMVAHAYGHPPGREAADLAATIIDHTWTPPPDTTHPPAEPPSNAHPAQPAPPPAPAPAPAAPNRRRWLLLLFTTVFVTLIVLVAGGIFAWANWSERPGGNETVALQVSGQDGTIPEEDMDRVTEILRQRVEGVAEGEPVITYEEDIVSVELPRNVDTDEVVSLMEQPGVLSLRAVVGVVGDGTATEDSGAGSQAADAELTLPGPDTSQELQLGPARLGNSEVASAQATSASGGRWQVEITFTDGGGETWSQLTGAAACHAQDSPQRRIATVLDEEIVTAPMVGASVACDVGIQGNNMVVTGQFTEQEAQTLARLVRMEPLPAGVEVAEQE